MLLGRSEPRLFTQPLRPLTPETSYGFDVTRFARDVLRRPLLPWQEFAVIHGGELLEDGRPRFRIVVLMVSRQSGKTELPVVLSAYWQFVEAVPLILGTSTKLDYAKESWTKAVKLVEKTPDLAALRPARWKREANGEQESWTVEGSRYKIAAANAEGGRSLTIDRGICDELRQHHDYTAWDAFEPACSAWDAQIWCLSNAGSDRSAVLNDLQDAARAFIETGDGDPRLGLLEWSAPDDADPEDVDALLQANPRVGYGLDLDVLLAAARRAKRLGGEALTGFRTERMCQRVRNLDPAIDPAAWQRCLDSGDLSGVRSRVALCVDLAPDQLHATVYAAALLDDGRVRLDVVDAWEGLGCADRLRRALPGLVERVKPQTVGWYPNGPAATLTADLAERRGWPPPGVTVQAIKAEMPAVCMSFDEQATAGRIAHSGDPLLDAQVTAAERLKRGDAWVFSRRGEGHVDALFAAAGAAHLARTMPAAVGKPRIVVARRHAEES